VQDRQRFLGHTAATAIITIQEDWYERALRCVLSLYELPSTSFHCVDDNAGYYQSERAVAPKSETVARAPLDLMAERGAELRVVPHLQPHSTEVAASTLAFSIIRMRNAVSAS
jgi:hypothetical protein